MELEIAPPKKASHGWRAAFAGACLSDLIPDVRTECNVEVFRTTSARLKSWKNATVIEGFRERRADIWKP